MKPEELVSIRKGLGISQKEFARRLGAVERTYQKWELGESPIRPMVAQSILNLVDLIKNESKIKSAKNTSEKLELMRQGLIEAVAAIKSLGGAERAAQRIFDTLEKNKAPSRDEIINLAGTVKSPLLLSSLISEILKIFVLEANKNPYVKDDVEYLNYVFENYLEEDIREQIILWIKENYVMTSPDVLASMHKSILKNHGEK